MQATDHAYGALPPISEMLMREANAWNALLQLNGSIGAAAHGVGAHDDALEYDDARETAAQREASYIGALSNLAALADSLTNETLKLRSLRKARHQVTSLALQTVMREHSNSALALGEGLARRGAVDLTNAIALVRARQQDTRSQLAQARTLLQAASQGEAALPPGARIVIGVRGAADADGGKKDHCRPVEEVLAAAYANGGEMSDASLAAALCDARRRRARGAGADPTRAAAPPPSPSPPLPPRRRRRRRPKGRRQRRLESFDIARPPPPPPTMTTHPPPRRRMTYSIQTKAEKDELVQARRLAQRDLGARIDRHLAEVGEQPASCGFCGLGALLARARTRAQPAAAAARDGAGHRGGHRRARRGCHRRRDAASNRSARALRAAQGQGRSARQAAGGGERDAEPDRAARGARRRGPERGVRLEPGPKAAALRAMRKVKAVEKQVASNQAALDAVEQQVDLMQQAVMQKTVASALQTSEQGAQEAKKLLQQAEGAVEDAAEARDMAEDLSTVMGEFANGGQHDDDDELLAELDALILGDVPTPPSEAAEEDEVAAAARDAAAIEARDAAWQDAERARRALPAAPKGRRRGEQAALLTPATAV